jgi:hypothetical protein
MPMWTNRLRLGMIVLRVEVAFYRTAAAAPAPESALGGHEAGGVDVVLREVPGRRSHRRIVVSGLCRQG